MKRTTSERLDANFANYRESKIIRVNSRNSRLSLFPIPCPSVVEMNPPAHKTRMLWLAGVLHAFTHLYQMALVPLYLLIQKDFKLESPGSATLFVTVLLMANFLPSYFMGVAADRWSRKK